MLSLKDRIIYLANDFAPCAPVCIFVSKICQSVIWETSQ